MTLLSARAAPPIVLNHRRERIRLLFLIIIIASAFQIGLRNHWPPPSRLDRMMQLEDNVTALLFLLLFVHPVFVLECLAPVFSTVRSQINEILSSNYGDTSLESPTLLPSNLGGFCSPTTYPLKRLHLATAR